jgi:subtilisin
MMKKNIVYITLTLLAIAGFQANAPAAGPPALAGGGRLQGIALTGDPGAMHRVLISFQTPPGEPERARVRELGGRVRHAYRLVPAICAHLPEAGVQAFARRPGVVRIEADGRVRAIDELSNAWGVAHIQSGEAHARGDTGAGVKVAVIDTGIDYNHPDISQNYVGGWNFVNDDADPMDDYGHGTFVAGIVAAAYNGVGVVGVAPDVELYALKVLDNTGFGWWSDVIAALQWAVDHGIQVTNNSYADDSATDPSVPDPVALRTAFDNAEAAGVLHVAAAGNSGNASGTGDNVTYPARFASVIAVAAINQSDSRASFSSTGPAVELSAPGVSIYSTTLGGGYGSGSGTSFASPHAAGAAALVISVGVTDANYNGRINDEVRAILTQSADDLGATGRDALYGWGLVNAARAAVPCEGDLEPDGDVDGRDLADLVGALVAGSKGIDVLAAFATDFGRTECP